jgi:DNA-binding IclR family transcriptional regulator
VTEQDTNLIQSLSRGLAALELVAKHSLTPRALAEALAVDRSTAYRILTTLAAHGFVGRDPLSDQYILSSHKIYALESTIHGTLHWPSLATPWMKQLRDDLGEAVSLAVLQGDEVVYVNHLPSLEALTVGPLLGLRRPVHVSAVGKAIVAFLPDDELETLIEHLTLQAMTPNTLTSREALRQELARVQAQGYAKDDEETFVGVRCVAAPIWDNGNNVIAAMGISGPASRVTIESIPDIGQRVRTLADEFSLSLGARRELPIREDGTGRS